MFVGRRDEKRQLESLYLSNRNNLIMLYGREGIGKTALCMEFSKNKYYKYFRAKALPVSLQLEQFKKIIEEVSLYRGNNKLVLIVDEYQFCAGNEFDALLGQLKTAPELAGKLMMILVSSSVTWVENSMEGDIESIRKYLTGIMKLTELTFREMVEWFPKLTSDELVFMRGVLGGVPKYLKLWQENRRVKENIISLALTVGCPLENEVENLLKSELRELSAYNAILQCMASGANKLNDMHNITGFSRAKISVYLKNLIEMDLVEKVYSVTVKHYENTQKGCYRIKDRFVDFYYAYVYPHIDLYELGTGREIFDKFIERDQDRFIKEAFVQVAREFLEIMSKRGGLAYQYSEFRTWVGKRGDIDIVASDSERHRLASFCFYSDRITDVEEMEEINKLIESAGMKFNEICLFSRVGYSAELTELAEKQGIMLVTISDL